MSHRRLAGFVGLLGAALVASAGIRALLFLGSPTAWFERLVSLLVIGGSGLGLLYAGYRLSTGAHPDDTGRYVVRWIAVCVPLFVLVALTSLYVGSTTVVREEVSKSIHLSGSVGLLVGTLVGLFEVRALSNADAAARAETRAESAAAERERLREQNDVLRHYVLNAVTVISGHATELEGVVPPDDRGSLEVIDERAQTLAVLVEHADRLSEPSRDVGATTDLDRSIEAAVRTASFDTDVTIEPPASPPDVRTPRSFEKDLTLLLDAMAAVAEDDARITLDCERSPAGVTLSLRATPAELPPAIRDSLFEPVGSSDGLKFYLSQTVVDSYADLEFRPTEGDTLAFDLALDCASEST